MTPIQEALHTIGSASNTKTVFRYLADEAYRLGMENISWVLKLPTPIEGGRIITLDSYADEWRERYFQSNYLSCDPTVKHGLASLTPLLWSDTKTEAPEFWEEAESYGLSVGIAQSLWDRHGCCSMLTMCRDKVEFSSSELAYKLPQISWLTQIAHIGMSRLILPSEVTQPSGSLSHRETEVLKLASTGLTSQEIGNRLNISKATVDRHMEAIRSKLHAENKTDAVVKAIRWGLI